jgi:hypothetical protein
LTAASVEVAAGNVIVASEVDADAIVVVAPAVLPTGSILISLVAAVASLNCAALLSMRMLNEELHSGAVAPELTFRTCPAVPIARFASLFASE